MEWFSTLSLALGSAWKRHQSLRDRPVLASAKISRREVPVPRCLDNWWIIGVAASSTSEFFADKIPYVDSVWDVVHTFIRFPPERCGLRRDIRAGSEHYIRRRSSAADSRSDRTGQKQAALGANLSRTGL